jgi:uncharacterized membrane protein
VLLLLWSQRLYAQVSNFTWLTPLVVLASLGGLGVLASAWARSFTPAWAKGWPGLLLGATLVACFVCWSYAQIAQFPGYGTDEAAFDQYAAIVALHGHNPYTTSMAPSFDLFRVSPNGYTFLLNGRPITNLSYPAGAFELYLPLLAAGINIQAAIIENVAFWVITIGLLYLLLPPTFKLVALVLGSLDMYVAYAVGGVTDALFMPFMLLAAYRWDRYGEDGGRGILREVGPLSMGLACSIKQNAWLVALFLLYSLYRERRYRGATPREALRAPLRYAAFMAFSFIATNAVYFFWNPRAWLHGVLTPVLAKAVPAGQGWVALTIYTGLGGGSLTAYTALLVVTALAVFVIYAVTYPVARYSLFLVSSLILFFGSRAFSSYLVTLAPPALLAALTIRPLSGTFHRRWKGIATLSVAAVFLSGLVAISIPPPLSMKVVKITTTGQLATVEAVTVAVKNWSSSPVSPAFTVQTGGVPTQFWHPLGGKVVIKPGATSVVTLIAPSFYANPSLGQGFQVVAYTENPATVSESPAVEPQTWHVALTPVALKQTYWPLYTPLKVRAQILDRFDRPVRVAGVPVYMGQIIYAQHGIQLAHAIISVASTGFTGLPGETPVAGYTDGDGAVTFELVGTVAGTDPTYFEANLQASRGLNDYPYGYSEILAVRFG